VSGTEPEALLFITPRFPEGNHHAGEADRWLLERRHADGEHWVEIDRFLVREDAEARLARLAAAGVPRDLLRVAKVHLVA
jgi:hypothetical protein